ncbi:hypothetical protein ACSU64_04480 [Bacillaceae bacterium C204]
MNDKMLTKEEFIQANQEDWIKAGEIYKKVRLANGLPRKKVSGILQISESKLFNFEHGHPVKEVNLLRAALRLFYKELDQKSYKKLLQYEDVRKYLIVRKLRNEVYFEDYDISPNFGSSSFGGSSVPPSFGNSSFDSEDKGFGNSSFDSEDKGFGNSSFDSEDIGFGNSSFDSEDIGFGNSSFDSEDKGFGNSSFDSEDKGFGNSSFDSENKGFENSSFDSLTKALAIQVLVQLTKALETTILENPK